MPRQNRDYDDPLYKAARTAARKRDGHQCSWPNCKKKTKLQCHHIQRWSDNVILRHSVDNLITLCSNHHYLIRGQETAYAPLFMRIVSERKNGRKS